MDFDEAFERSSSSRCPSIHSSRPSSSSSIRGGNGNLNGENGGRTTARDQQSSLFCNKDNTSKAVAYLSKELNILGFDTLYQNGEDSLDVVHLINVTYELLQQQKRNMKLQEELENRNVRMSSDMEFLHTNEIRIKEKLSQSERMSARYQESERQLSLQVKGLIQKLKTEKEEVKRLNSVQQQREAQYQHEVRKRERESTRLKERLHQLLGNHPQDRRSNMEMINNLQRKDGSRGKWKTGSQEVKQEEELYQSVIRDFEERHKVILLENTSLRDLLSFVGKEVNSLLKLKIVKENPASVSTNDNNSSTMAASEFEDSLRLDLESRTDSDVLEQGHFYLPLEIVHKKLQRNLEIHFDFIRNCLKQLEDTVKSFKTSQQESTELSVLREKLENYEEVISRQEHLIKQALMTSPSQEPSLNPYLIDEHLLEEKEKLKKEKLQLEAEKLNFEKQRHMFNEAAVKLNQERLKFEEEQDTFLKNQLLDETMLQSSPVNLTPRSAISERAGNVCTPDYLSTILSRSTENLHLHESLDFSDRPESAMSAPGNEETASAFGNYLKFRPSKMQGCLAELEAQLILGSPAALSTSSRSSSRCSSASAATNAGRPRSSTYATGRGSGDVRP